MNQEIAGGAYPTSLREKFWIAAKNGSSSNLRRIAQVSPSLNGDRCATEAIISESCSSRDVKFGHLPGAIARWNIGRWRDLLV